MGMLLDPMAGGRSRSRLILRHASRAHHCRVSTTMSALRPSHAGVAPTIHVSSWHHPERFRRHIKPVGYRGYKRRAIHGPGASVPCPSLTQSGIHARLLGPLLRVVNSVWCCNAVLLATVNDQASPGPIFMRFGDEHNIVRAMRPCPSEYSPPARAPCTLPAALACAC
jgi:hypothetical protein